MRIMLVEDDLQLGAALHRALELNGFESVWVRRLKDARALVAHGGAALIVLDLGLPDGEGLQLLEFIRGRGGATPVIILTARDGLDDRVRGLNSGADDYVTKPVAVSELIARIHAVSRRAAGFVTQRWVLGDLTIDLDTHTVSVSEVDVALTPSEFKLLIELHGAGVVLGESEPGKRGISGYAERRHGIR